MHPSRRPRYAVSHSRIRILLASLALITVGIHASAQEQTARLVKDANRSLETLPPSIDWLMPLGQRVVFPMDTLATGQELWTSDGTPKGTRLLKDILPGTGGSRPRQPTAFGTGANARIAFTTPNSVPNPWGGFNLTEHELWITDGTEAGTLNVDPPHLGVLSLIGGTPAGVFVEDWLHDRGLIFTDGTAAGTRTLNPSLNGSRKFIPYGIYAVSGSWCYFVTDTNELWRSDGTDAATTKIATLPAGNPAAWQLSVTSGHLFASGVHDSQLWSCPIDGGTFTRVGPPVGTTWIQLSEMTALGDELFFISWNYNSNNHAYEYSLWASDGTEAGTRRISLTPQDQSFESKMQRKLTLWKDAIYFWADYGQAQLWRTDGTEAGTFTYASIPDPQTLHVEEDLQPTPDYLYFHTTDSDSQVRLWRTAGDAASTQPVKGTPTFVPDYEYYGSPPVAATSTATYFVARGENPDAALCRLKNQKGGSQQLTKLEKTNGSGITNPLVGAPPYEAWNGNLLELVNTGKGHELWQLNPADGKSRSISKLPASLGKEASLGFLQTTATGPLFSITEDPSRRELWTTDGTKRGTYLLEEKPVLPGSFVQVGDTWFYSSSTFMKMDASGVSTPVVDAELKPLYPRGAPVLFQGQVHFLASYSASGNAALWRTDGTPQGTVRIKDSLYGGDNGGAPENLSVVNGKMYFIVYRTGIHSTLWRSDGTAEGTVEASPTPFGFVATPILDVGGIPAFVAGPIVGGVTQWWFLRDGNNLTALSTWPINHAYPSEPSYPKHAQVGSRLFYCANMGSDVELWITDGTSNNTRLVKDINPGLESSDPSDMLVVGDHVYFTAFHRDHGSELWRSDGTEAGTILVADVEPGPESSSPQGLKVIGDKLYFSAERRTTGRELYSVDLPQ